MYMQEGLPFSSASALCLPLPFPAPVFPADAHLLGHILPNRPLLHNTRWQLDILIVTQKYSALA